MKNNNPSNFKVGDTLQSKEWGEFKIVEHINARYITIMFLNTGNKYVRQKGEIIRGAVCDRDVIVERLKPTKISKLNKSNSFDKFMESWDKTTHRKDVFKLPYFSYCKVNGWVYKGFTYVDKYTYEFASKLKCIKNSYIQFTLSKDNCRRLGIIKPSKKTTLPLHSWVKAMPTGVKDLVTDHKNGNKLDNRLHNLRIADSSQNSANSKASSTTGFKGVKIIPEGKKGKPIKNVVAQGWIPFQDKYKFLGKYYTIEEAAKAVDVWNIQNYGEFTRLNLKRSIYEEMGLLPKRKKKYNLP